MRTLPSAALLSFVILFVVFVRYFSSPRFYATGHFFVFVLISGIIISQFSRLDVCLIICPRNKDVRNQNVKLAIHPNTRYQEIKLVCLKSVTHQIELCYSFRGHAHTNRLGIGAFLFRSIWGLSVPTTWIVQLFRV